MPWLQENSLAFQNKNLLIVILPTMDVTEAIWTMHLNGLLTMVESTQNPITLTLVLMVPATTPRFGSKALGTFNQIYAIISSAYLFMLLFFLSGGNQSCNY